LKSQETLVDGMLSSLQWSTQVVHMVLAMCRPVKHPTTGVYLFRKRVPKQLRSLVGRAEIKRSLGTKDKSKAGRLHREMAEAIERGWALLAAAPVALSHKEIMRLAGVAYQDIVGIHPDNPGPASVWEHHIRLSEEARAKGKLDQWVGPYVDTLLVREGIKTTPECRLEIIEETDKAVVQAARQRLKEAQGDYRPDPDAGRFPRQETTAPSGGVKAAAGAASRNWHRTEIMICSRRRIGQRPRLDVPRSPQRSRTDRGSPNSPRWRAASAVIGPSWPGRYRLAASMVPNCHCQAGSPVARCALPARAGQALAL